MYPVRRTRFRPVAPDPADYPSDFVEHDLTPLGRRLFGIDRWDGNEVNGCVLVADDDDHDLFARWLAKEDDVIVNAVDGGVYGWPVTIEGMRKGYKTYSRRFEGDAFPWRAGRLASNRSYYASTGPSGARVGHVDCLTVEHRDGTGIVGWIFMVYVLPDHRGKNVGKEMIRAAYGTYPAWTPVRLTVLKNNGQAKKFYESLGMKAVDERLFPGGHVAEIMEIVVQ